MAQRYPLAILILVSFEIFGCLADLEQMVQVFNAAVDSLAPPDKAAKFKADMEKARPCLENLVTELGEGTLEQVLRGIVPLGMRCGSILMKSHGDSDARKKIFVECINSEAKDFINGLPENEQAAFVTAKHCVKDLLQDLW